MDPAKGFSGLRAHKGRPLYDRLVERTIPVPWSGCWLWMGGMCGRYGQAFLPGGIRTSAHRAMVIAQGYPLTSEEGVCHRCDVPLCINPDHLFVGTQADNLADMRSKGRQGHSYAIEPFWRERIREDTDTPIWAIAMWFGVSHGTVRNIRRAK